MPHGAPRRFWGDQRGAVAMIFALSATVLLGVAALAVDAGRLYVLKVQLQGASDAAALAAVSQLPDQEAAIATAVEYAAKNMSVGAHGAVLTSSNVELGRWNAATRAFTPGASPATAVRVSAARSAANGNPADTFFAGILGFREVDVRARTVAQAAEATGCLWALNPTAAASVRLETNAQINLPNCGLKVNSSDANAMWAQSGACITATGIGVVGNYSGSCMSPEPETGIAPFDDPLGDLDAPSYGACTQTTQHKLEEGGTYTMSPGVYCGGIKVGENATVTFQPGLYVVAGTGLRLEEGSTARGDDVMFYFTRHGSGSWGTLHVEDDTTLELSAPISGPFAGIAVYQDRATPGSSRAVIEDVSRAFIEGAIYAPSIHFWVETNGELELTGHLVADRFTFETNARLEHSGAAAAFGGGRGLLVN